MGDQIEIVAAKAQKSHAMALIDKQGALWFTFSRPWWDLASWVWWLLTPGQKQWVILRKESGRKVRIRAVRLTGTHVRIG